MQFIIVINRIKGQKKKHKKAKYLKNHRIAHILINLHKFLSTVKGTETNSKTANTLVLMYFMTKTMSSRMHSPVCW